MLLSPEAVATPDSPAMKTRNTELMMAHAPRQMRKMPLPVQDERGVSRPMRRSCGLNTRNQTTKQENPPGIALCGCAAQQKQLRSFEATARAFLSLFLSSYKQLAEASSVLALRL
jgi:hypothetical protein